MHDHSLPRFKIENKDQECREEKESFSLEETRYEVELLTMNMITGLSFKI